nr:MAG TPA: hypothetical protein [Caudoviricetes sp.]
MRVKRFMNVILERKALYIKPYKGYNQYNNRRLHYISNDNRLSTFNSVLLHYIIPSVETFRWWYYSAYMEETTTRKKTHKNAPNITETLKKPRIALFIIIKDK